MKDEPVIPCIEQSSLPIQNPKFKIQNSLLLLLLFLASLEAGVLAWRHNVQISTAAVFSYPAAVANFGKSATLAPAIEMYRADRGAECKLTAPDNTRLTVLYFEWDQLKVSPVMNFTFHAPEICNSGIGYKLLEVLPPRDHAVAGQPPLTFDCTHFTDPSGKHVYIFKVVWLQGYGCMRMREDGPGARPIVEGEERFARIKNSFVRHSGAARIVEAAVFDAHGPEQAWQVFQDQVLTQLSWSTPRT